MMTVNEVSKLSGVSIRTLQYYDQIGLLGPTRRTQAGYRLYDDASLDKLQQILLFRELEFPLKQICQIVGRADFDREKALTQQIELLTLKRDRLDRLLALAREIKQSGEINMDFSAFDNEKLRAYAEQAKAQWGDTDAYREYAQKHGTRAGDDERAAAEGLMAIFGEFGRAKATPPSGEAAQALVEKLRGYICAHYYNCTPQILRGLGAMYSAGGEMTENIDRAGGEGTAAFATAAINAYCDCR